MVERILIEEDFKNLLHLRFDDEKIKFQHAEFQSLSENLEGLLGEYYILKITFTRENTTDTENFFVKTKPTKNKSQMEVSNSINAYGKEIFFYSVLLREYESRGYNISFAPKMYMSKNGDTLVMEDLKCNGFAVTGRMNFYNISQVKCCLNALALFHAASFAFEEEKSRELGRVFRLGEEYPVELKECYYTFDDPKSAGSAFICGSVEGLVALVNYLPEDEIWKEDFKKRIQDLDLGKFFAPHLKSRKACGHSDLWSNNILFQSQDGIATKCCLIDFQIIRYYQPALDALLGIYNNTTVDFRNQHTQEILDYYYQSLTVAVEDRGFSLEEIYPRSEYDHDVKALIPSVILIVTCNHSIQFIDLDKAKILLTGDVDGLFNDKPNVIGDAFKHIPPFRNIMTEHLYELHQVLPAAPLV